MRKTDSVGDPTYVFRRAALDRVWVEKCVALVSKWEMGFDEKVIESSIFRDLIIGNRYFAFVLYFSVLCRLASGLFLVSDGLESRRSNHNFRVLRGQRHRTKKSNSRRKGVYRILSL